MVIGDEVEALALILEPDMVLNGPIVISQMEPAVGLDAGKVADRFFL
jgi:hypothetical protein